MFLEYLFIPVVSLNVATLFGEKLVLRPQAIPQPAARVYEPPSPFPDFSKLADMLTPDDSGLVPYADVACDVGPEARGEVARLRVGKQLRDI